jgi:predicted nucleic acid-binding protein
MSDLSRESCWLADASVLINLLCMPCPGKVLAALKAPVVSTPIVLRELRRLDGRGHGQPPLELARAFLAEVQLSEEELERFGALVSASPPDALDDGEASVLAVAASRGWSCLIDERKATRLAAARVPPVETLSTAALLRRAAPTLTEVEVLACLTGALRDARMRVPHEHYAWVVERIGADQLSMFPSLKQRR